MTSERSAVKRAPIVLIAVGAFAVGLLGLLYLVVQPRDKVAATAAPEPDQSQPTAGSEDVAGLRRELASLRSQVSTLRGDVSTAKDQAGSDKAATPKDTRTDDQIRADDERRYREYMAGVAEAFRQEAVDPKWAGKVSATVRTAIANDEVIRSLARDVDCRSHSCRVVIEETSANFFNLNKELPAFASSLGGTLPSVSAEHVQDGSGSGSVVLYMSTRPDQQATASR
jgi:hypothetical protein